ncbi:MAG: deoxyhypusine synthase family protein [Candidatus Lokiarchaeota archaeon]|nr:deoxyhypusine synthase family protein [Candidatus Lokiarchaeota archaeon]
MTNTPNDEFLKKKISPFNVYQIKSIEDVLQSLKECGFQGRNLGKALDLLYKMVSSDKILTVLTLSGAMVPAGMGEIICALIEKKLIDVIVSTGANVIHDLVDVFTNIGHYVGNANVDDDELFQNRINRIYDVFLPEDNYLKTEDEILSLIKNVFQQKTIDITPSEFLLRLGENINKRCILSIAAKYNVPIFVPALSDSELALDLIIYSLKEDYEFKFDILGDITKFGEIIKSYKEHGTLIIGGGVPRNWAQQIFPFLDQIKKLDHLGYKYSVRIHTATEYDGGLSGCTVSESKSWGKYSLESSYVSVWCDATIALPILITGLFQKLKII